MSETINQTLNTPNIIRLFDYANAPYSRQPRKELVMYPRVIPRHEIKQMNTELSVLNSYDIIAEELSNKAIRDYYKYMLTTLDMRAKQEDDVVFDTHDFKDKFIWVMMKHHNLFESTYGALVNKELVNSLCYYIIIAKPLVILLQDMFDLRTPIGNNIINYIGDINHIRIYSYDPTYINNDVNFYMGCYQTNIFGLPAGISLDFGVLNRVDKDVKLGHYLKIWHLRCVCDKHPYDNRQLPYVRLFFKNKLG